MKRMWTHGGLLTATVLSMLTCGATPRSAVVHHGIVVITPETNDAVGERIAATTVEYLTKISGTPIVSVHAPDDQTNTLADLQAIAEEHRAGLAIVLDAQRLANAQIDATLVDSWGPSDFWLDTHLMGDGTQALDDQPGATIVLAAGSTRLARQYAAYELLRRLGVRFFHPEHEYVPTHDLADLRDLVQRPTVLHRDGPHYRPDFAWRSWTFHSSHPLEHLEAFSDPNHPIDEALRVNDWIVKGFGNRFRGAGRGVVSPDALAQRAAELDQWRQQLGFARGTGISLHNLQQGASAEIDPNATTPVKDQIETLVADKLEAMPDAQWFGIHFGPTEFTTTPDKQTVQWIDWAGQAALRIRPDIEVEVNVHATGEQPSPHYDDLGCSNGTNDQGLIDYYDLAFHTDPRMAASVHTVMFYPLEGPARVYHQKSFAHKLCLMKQASAQGRPLRWFPEGSWWLSFDNTIPVYLPLYMHTRARDIELLRPLLPDSGGTLTGHRMFNSGQEWGYWQQDYVVGLMAWNTQISLPEVLGEIFDPLCAPMQWRDGCAARSEAIAVLEEVMEHQRVLLMEREDWEGRPGGLYTYFAGEDDADVLAANSGLEFRPVRVSFDTVLHWDADALEHFRATDLMALREAADAYQGWVRRLDAYRSEVPEAGRPWLDEVIDGLQINHLRAAHTAFLYDAIGQMRQAQLAGQERPSQAGRAAWQAAADRLASVEAVIRRRELAYRYPALQTHGGGLTEATAVDNGTPYPYRVFTKTHRLTYWTGRQEQVTRLLDGDMLEPTTLAIREALDRVGTGAMIQWPMVPELHGSINIAGQSIEAPTSTLELGSSPGYWSVEGQLTALGSPIAIRGGLVRSNILATTPAQGMTLRMPDDPATQGVLSGLLPSLRWAWVDSPPALVFAPDDNGDGSVAFDQLIYAPLASGMASGFVTEPVAFELPVATSAGGQALTIAVTDATLSGSVGDQGLVDPIGLEGQLSVADIATAAQVLAGFDYAGTIALLAGVWGFDPANPPARVPVHAEFDLLTDEG